MSADQIGADTDLIKSPALRSSRELMRETAKRFEDAVAAGTPVVPAVWTDLDAQIKQSAEANVKVVSAVLAGLLELSQGDITNVGLLSDLLHEAEDEATHVASTDTRGTGGRHSV